MSRTLHVDAEPTEDTPLIAASHDGNETSAAPAPAPAAGVSLGRGLAITVLMGLLILIQATNISMMTTIQSAIAADLNAFAETAWFSAAYLIGMSCMTPLAGRLSAIFTPRVYVLWSCALLSAGLFVTAAARSLAGFLAGRAIAGAGSGGLLSTSLILVLDLASTKRRGLCIGMTNAGYTTGVASGAVFAGLLTTAYGWRLIFWIQAPAALVLGPLLYLAIPHQLASDESDELKDYSTIRKLARVDYAGAATLTISLVLLLYSLASPAVSLVLIFCSAVVFAIFLLIETRFTSEPIVPVTVLRARSVLLTCASSLTLMLARWAVLFYTPVYAMAVRDWSPASAGVILVPTNFGFGLGGLLVGWMHIRNAESYYLSCLAACLFFIAAILVLSFLSTPCSPTPAYVMATFINGLCAGSYMNYNLSHVLHLTRPEVHYIISSLVVMTRGFAGSFGAAIGGGFFARALRKSLQNEFRGIGRTGPRVERLITKLVGSPALVRTLDGVERDIAVHSYEYATRMLFLAGAVMALVAMMVQAGTGWKGPAVEKADEDEEDESSVPSGIE